MAGFQFAHVEAYARVGAKTKDGSTRRSIKEIIAETVRDAGSIPHIENPQAPALVYGCDPRQLEQMAEDYASQTKDAKGRKFRKDGLILMAGVVSLPREREGDFPAFSEAVIEWLKEKYGDRLKSVVAHDDEAHPHLHFYVIPEVGERLEDIHEGFKASKEAKAQGKLKGEQNQAYKAAMRAWQDDFSNTVAMRFGLTRLGPGRRRLTRKQWVLEQKQAQFFADAKARAKQGYKQGYEEGKAKGYRHAKREALAEGLQVGERLGSVFKGVLGGLHQPTAQALQAARDAEARAEEERKKRKKAEAEAKQDADKRVTKIAQELHQVKENRDGLSKELTKQTEANEWLGAVVSWYEKRYGPAPKDIKPK